MLQHDKLFDNLVNLKSISIANNSISQINSLQSALKNVSGQLTIFALKQQQEDLISAYAKINEQTIELAQNIEIDKEISDINSAKIDSLLATLISFALRNKKIAVYSLLVIDILLRGTSAHQYYDFLKTKPELASKRMVRKPQLVVKVSV